MTLRRVGQEFTAFDPGYYASIAVLSDGRFLITADDNHAIRARTFDAAGVAGGGELTVNTNLDPDQFHPAVTPLSDGRSIVVWASHLGGNDTDLHARYLRADGQMDGNEFFVLHGVRFGGGPSGPEVAALQDGRSVAVWSDDNVQAWARLVNADGSLASTLTSLGGGPHPSVAGLADGHWVAAWWQTVSAAQPYFRIFDANGNPTGGSTPLGLGLAPSDESPSLAALPQGGFIVAWADRTGAAHVRIFDQTGSAAAGAIPIDFAGHQPLVTVLADGRFVVVWSGVMARVFAADGSPADTEFIVNADPAFHPQSPTSVEALADGSFVVAWTAQTSGPPLIRTAIFDPTHLDGTSQADTLKGGNFADSITGAGGNDLIAGGAGADQSVYAGARAEYDVRTYSLSGVLQTVVAHQGGMQGDGIDTLTGVESLRFSDHTAALAGAQLNHHSSVDANRYDDVLFQSATTGQVYYAKMGSGAFQSWGVDTGALGTDWKAIATGDVNPLPGSGAETFVQQQSTGSIYYSSIESGAVTWGVVTTGLTADWKLRAIADLNGDASVDAIVQNQSTGTIYFADMQGGTFHGWGVVNQSLTADWKAIGAGDINRDGYADVVVQQQSTGTTYYANMANGTFSGWGVVSQNLTPNWKVKAVADVTGDGFADVIFQNSAGGGVAAGTTYFADMKNGVFDHWGVVTANVTAAWVAQGTADVDNDGFNDVLFQNQANGTTYYANMGPAGFEGWGAVAGNIGPDWQVV